MISALDDKPHDDAEVRRVYHGIREAVMIDGDGSGKTNMSELFHNGPSQNFRRAALGVIVQCFQQITGSYFSSSFALSL